MDLLVHIHFFPFHIESLNYLQIKFHSNRKILQKSGLPINPFGQRQTYLSIKDLHVPLFLQGSGLHWSIIVSQKSPVIPFAHVHRGPDSVLEHTAPFKHYNERK